MFSFVNHDILNMAATGLLVNYVAGAHVLKKAHKIETPTMNRNCYHGKKKLRVCFRRRFC